MTLRQAWHACDAMLTTPPLPCRYLLTMARRGRHARVHSGALPACAHRACPRGGGRGEHRWPMGAGGTAQRRRRGGKRLPKGSRAANEREGEGCGDCRAGHTSHTHDRDRDRHARGDRDNFSCAGANRHVHVQPARQHTAGVRACPADEVVAPRPEGVDCRERSLCSRRPVRVNWYPVSSLVYPPLSLFRQTHTPPRTLPTERTKGLLTPGSSRCQGWGAVP